MEEKAFWTPIIFDGISITVIKYLLENIFFFFFGVFVSNGLTASEERFPVNKTK